LSEQSTGTPSCPARRRSLHLADGGRGVCGRGSGRGLFDVGDRQGCGAGREADDDDDDDVDDQYWKQEGGGHRDDDREFPEKT